MVFFGDLEVGGVGQFHFLTVLLHPTDHPLGHHAAEGMPPVGVVQVVVEVLGGQDETLLEGFGGGGRNAGDEKNKGHEQARKPAQRVNVSGYQAEQLPSGEMSEIRAAKRSDPKTAYETPSCQTVKKCPVPGGDFLPDPEGLHAPLSAPGAEGIGGASARARRTTSRRSSSGDGPRTSPPTNTSSDTVVIHPTEEPNQGPRASTYRG